MASVEGEHASYPLMVGFAGTHPDDKEVEILKNALAQNLICGVIFFRHNIIDPDQLSSLTESFLEANTALPPLLAVDQEGGRVQRLSSANGFVSFPSAKEVGAMGREARAKLYADFAAQVKRAGLNFVLGPDVDLHSEASPVIGALGRAYSADPDHVCACAQDFVEAHRRRGIATSLKHFPGHGFALGDTHKGFVDVTKTFDARELMPFETLARKGLADSIMVAHVASEAWEKGVPASLSPYTRKVLRGAWGYDGVVISDDLHMGAILDAYPDPCQVGAMAARAGIDVLLYSYNKLAAQGEKGFDAMSLATLQRGIRAHLGEDFEELQEEAARRVRRLRETLREREDDVLCG